MSFNVALRCLDKPDSRRSLASATRNLSESMNRHHRACPGRREHPNDFEAYLGDIDVLCNHP